MAKSIVIEGDTYDAALNKGLDMLGVDSDKVTVDVIQRGDMMGNIIVKPYKLLIKCQKDSEDSNMNFYLEYRYDGVYLKIVRQNKERIDNFDNIIIENIKRKEIEYIDSKALYRAIYTEAGKWVKIAEHQTEKLIDEEVDVHITKDKMQAYIRVKPPLGGNSLGHNDIMNVLENYGVKFGVDKHAVKELLDNRKYNNDFLVATGQSVQNGSNGKIVYHINLNKNYKPKINDDGSVDYHHLDLIENVKKGQILANIIPPTQGNPGRTVDGDIIKPKPGKSVKLLRGKNVSVSDDGLTYTAEIDGNVELINNRIHVYSMYEINGDVDLSTGNIDFVGNVIIRGNVLSGFSVKASGYIRVYGVVEAANLMAEGDVVLNKGFQGMGKGHIYSKSNVISRFIENGIVFAKNDVIAEAIMHSKISCGGKIQVDGRKGLIVGGELKAEESIRAVTIGSPMATATSLEVGIDPSIKDEYLQLTSELGKMIQEDQKANQVLSLIDKIESTAGSLGPGKQELRKKALNIRNMCNSKIPELKVRIWELECKLKVVDKGKIEVKNIIYPGVSINIGPSVMNIQEEHNYVSFKREHGKISFSSYN